MKHYDCTLITAAAYEQPEEPNWYVQQILEEDGLVQRALEAQGWRVNRVAWSSDFDWSSTRLAVFRTPWGYSKEMEAFRAWLERARQQVHFVNPLGLVYWNSDKHYLSELAEKGVAVPPTQFIKKGSRTTLAQVHQALGWQHTVLKPTISAGGRHTYQLTPNDWEAYEGLFQELLAAEDLMVQPFLERVVTQGEIALMLIDGEFTHAVLKRAKIGDFRVQDNYGGTVEAYEPSAEALQLAKAALTACPLPPLYARVDLVWDNNGALAVSELEIFEPELWFRFHPPAAERLATALGKYLQQAV